MKRSNIGPIRYQLASMMTKPQAVMKIALWRKIAPTSSARPAPFARDISDCEPTV